MLLSSSSVGIHCWAVQTPIRQSSYQFHDTFSSRHWAQKIQEYSGYQEFSLGKDVIWDPTFQHCPRLHLWPSGRWEDAKRQGLLAPYAPLQIYCLPSSGLLHNQRGQSYRIANQKPCSCALVHGLGRSVALQLGSVQTTIASLFYMSVFSSWTPAKDQPLLGSTWVEQGQDFIS